MEYHVIHLCNVHAASFFNKRTYMYMYIHFTLYNREISPIRILFFLPRGALRGKRFHHSTPENSLSIFNIVDDHRLFIELHVYHKVYVHVHVLVYTYIDLRTLYMYVVYVHALILLSLCSLTGFWRRCGEEVLWTLSLCPSLTPMATR